MFCQFTCLVILHLSLITSLSPFSRCWFLNDQSTLHDAYAESEGWIGSRQTPIGYTRMESYLGETGKRREVEKGGEEKVSL